MRPRASSRAERVLCGSADAAWTSPAVGAVVGFWINKGAQDNIAPGHTQWLLSFAVQLVPSGIFLAGLFFLVESPRWLIRRGRREEGLKKLCYLRQLPLDHVYMREEIEMVRPSPPSLSSP